MKQNEENKELATAPMEIAPRELAGIMAVEVEKRKMLTEYIAKHMKSGVDYGSIKIGGRDSKPSLFKPGAEKFTSLFKLRAAWEKDAETWEMLGSEAGTICYICKLYTLQDKVVGEGRGASSVREKGNPNTALKIAKKRAFVDAVLSTGGLSDFFTQDLEDLAGDSYDNSPVPDNVVPTVSYDEGPSNPVEKYMEKKGIGGKKTTPTEQKRTIKELIDRITLHPIEQTKEGYEKYVLENTGLELKPQNYAAIIQKLNDMEYGEV